MPKFIDLKDVKIGRLTGKSYLGNGLWEFQCDCGKVKVISGGDVRSGHSSSCGCYSIELLKERNKKYNNYNLSGDFGIGYTLKNDEFYFDLDDYDKIKDYCWRLNDGYIVTSINRKTIAFHNVILNSVEGMVIDHTDRNKRNNLKENLRYATYQQNSFNSNLKSSNNSGISGVYWSKEKKRWCSQISINNKTFLLGGFHNFDDAVVSRLSAEMEYFGKDFSPQRHLFHQYGIS